MLSWFPDEAYMCVDTLTRVDLIGNQFINR